MFTYEIITDPEVMKTRADVLELVRQANPSVDAVAYLESLPRRVTETRFTYIVQYDDGKLTAFAGLSCAPFIKMLFIDNIVVSKAVRGRGYGSALIQKIREWSKELDFSKIFLYTRSETARKGSTLFYAKNDISITGFGLMGDVASAADYSEVKKLQKQIDAQKEALAALADSIEKLEQMRNTAAAQLIQVFWRQHHIAKDLKSQLTAKASDHLFSCKR